MDVVLRILACLLIPMIWGLSVEYIFETIRRRKAATADHRQDAGQ